MTDVRRLIIVILVTGMVIFGWQYFSNNNKNEVKHTDAPQMSIVTKDEALRNSKDHRVIIDTPKVKGSINLKGAVFDDIELREFAKTLENKHEKVELLNPANTRDAYFAHFGFVTEEMGSAPTSHTMWRTDNHKLAIGYPVTLSWTNEKNIQYLMRIEIDEDYMFTVNFTVNNHSGHSISLMPYGLISKVEGTETVVDNSSILHEGPIGVFNNVLGEVNYDKMQKEKKVDYKDNQTGWIGFTDKYWLSSIIPDSRYAFNASFNYYKHGKVGDANRFQVDFVSEKIMVPAGGSISYVANLFSGAKKIELLDKYKEEYNIDNFDKAVDFGWLYFLTKPMSLALSFINKYTNNFGVAILILTVVIKLLMLPLANKSYESITKMKELNPVITRLKERYQDDKLRFNYELMQLYKREKVNPLSGCLPLLVQIPVFFALYKVLYISIDSRHAPFFGWVQDLSAPDPTSLLNLFGLLPFAAPDFLNIGAWAVIMGITMYMQQRLNPEPTDPVQAKMMKFMPVIFVVMFYHFPAGLVIYWAWNNILSMLQQLYVQGRVKKKLNRF